MCLAKSATLSSASGSTPRTSVPRTVWSKDSMPWACTKGAAARTCGCLAASSATRCQLDSSPSKPEICTWDATPRMRVRSSVWKPFITDSTTISAATPRAMPSIETSEMKDMKRLRPCALRLERV